MWYNVGQWYTPRVRYTAVVKKLSTGEVRSTNHESYGATPEQLRYMWTDGNDSCDCNRFLYFERAGGVYPDIDVTVPCGDVEYEVLRLVLEDGAVIPLDDHQE